MSVEESIQQIETLIEAWQLDEADLNQTDINAMQALLKENQKLEQALEENKQLKEEVEEYKNPIKYFKYANKNVTNENKQLKDNWNKLKEYCQNNSFMQNTREYGTLTVVDADELAIYMEELEGSDSNAKD